MSVTRDTSGDAMAEAFAAPIPADVEATPEALRLLWALRRDLRVLLADLDILLKRAGDGTREYRLRQRINEARGRCINAYAKLSDIERAASRTAAAAASAAGEQGDPPRCGGHRHDGAEPGGATSPLVSETKNRGEATTR